MNVAAGTRTPQFDGVHYDRPGDYLAIHASFADPAYVRAKAAEVEGEGLDAVRNVLRWVRQHVQYRDADASGDTYHWRTFERLIEEGTYGGCAEHSILVGALLRAKGVPTVWVKTLDRAWIRSFVRTGETAQWNGHVFLEVFLDGRWRLLDAMRGEIYADYNPTERSLPGARYAYDKGESPYDLPLSSRWAEWKAQTLAFFTGFDLSRLPADEGAGTPLSRKCFVVANGPYYEWVQATCRELGFDPGMSFNTDFDQLLPNVRGHLLVVVRIGGESALPEAYWPREIGKDAANELHGIHCSERPDGTLVVLLTANDAADLRAVLGTLRSSPPAGCGFGA